MRKLILVVVGLLLLLGWAAVKSMQEDNANGMDPMKQNFEQREREINAQAEKYGHAVRYDPATKFSD